MKKNKKIIIIILALILLVCGISLIIFGPKLYYVKAFNHKDNLDKIECKYNEPESETDYYNCYFRNNKKCKFPKMCGPYYGAKIVFPDGELIIEENRIDSLLDETYNEDTSIIYLNKKISSKKVRKYLGEYVDIMHDNNHCGVGINKIKKLNDNYYYLVYSTSEEC
ncbi:MAG: hypothetical protein IKE63_01805 [Bacilli bacterium]|nr:hypothetical protein [Bacilli bacterium]